jgi:hypothetical protein
METKKISATAPKRGDVIWDGHVLAGVIKFLSLFRAKRRGGRGGIEVSTGSLEVTTVSVVCMLLSPRVDYRVFWLKDAHDRI